MDLDDFNGSKMFKDVFCSCWSFRGRHTMPGTTRLFLLWALSRQRQGFSVEAVEDKIYQDFVVVYWGQISTNHNRVEVWSIFGGDGQLPARIRAMTSGIHQRPLASSHTFTSSLKAVDASGCQWMPVVASGCQWLELHETLENLESWCFETGASADRRPFPPSHRIWDDWDVDWQDLPLQPDQTWMNWYLGWNTVVGTVVAVLILQLKFFRILTSNHFLIGFWSSTVMVGSSLLRNNKWFQADWLS